MRQVDWMLAREALELNAKPNERTLSHAFLRYRMPRRGDKWTSKLIRDHCTQSHLIGMDAFDCNDGEAKSDNGNKRDDGEQASEQLSSKLVPVFSGHLVSDCYFSERSRPRVDLHVLTLTFTPDQSYPTRFAILFHFMLLIFVLTDANEATYSIEFGSNLSLR